MRDLWLCLIVSLTLCGTPGLAQDMVAVNVDRATFHWQWAPEPGSGMPEGFRVRCTHEGRTKLTEVGPDVRQAPLREVTDGVGNWACTVSAFNLFGESESSAPMTFMAGRAPMGTIQGHVEVGE